MNAFPCYSLVFGFNNLLLNDSSYRRDFIDSGDVSRGTQRLLDFIFIRKDSKAEELLYLRQKTKKI
jgi:hypothetical protein